MKIFIFLLIIYGAPILALIGSPQTATGNANSAGVVFIDNGYQINEPCFCNGVIIHNSVVLTTAVCTNMKSRFDVIIQMGTTRMQDEGDFYYVESYHQLDGLHVDARYELALIRTTRRFHFTAYGLPMAIPRESDMALLSSDQNYDVISAGSILKDHPYYLSSEMMREKWPIHPNSTCEASNGKPRSKEVFICLGDQKATKLVPSDIAAPLIKNRMVYGLGVYNNQDRNFVAWFISIGHAADRIYKKLKEIPHLEY